MSVLRWERATRLTKEVEVLEHGDSVGSSGLRIIRKGG